MIKDRKVVERMLHGGKEVLELYRGEKQVWKRQLPGAYIELPYLQGSREQWIDSGIEAREDVGVEAKIYREYNGAAYFLFGAEHFIDSGNRKSLLMENGNFRVDGEAGNFYPSKTKPIMKTGDHVLRYDCDGKFYLNGTEITDVNNPHSSGAINGSNNKKLTFFIGATNTDGTATSNYRLYGNDKLYYIKFYDTSGKILGYFTPALRIHDQKPGMYDWVTDKFFTNANTSATSDFIYAKPLWKIGEVKDTYEGGKIKRNIDWAKLPRDKWNYEYNNKVFYRENTVSERLEKVSSSSVMNHIFAPLKDQNVATKGLVGKFYHFSFVQQRIELNYPDYTSLEGGWNYFIAAKQDSEDPWIVFYQLASVKEESWSGDTFVYDLGKRFMR